MLIAGTYAALGEGLALAEREGLPLPELVAALSGGAARSWILENRSKNVIENEYPLGFRVALHLKDLRIALAEADRHGLPMAVSRLVAEQEERLVAAGHGDEDNSVARARREGRGRAEGLSERRRAGSRRARRSPCPRPRGQRQQARVGHPGHGVRLEQPERPVAVEHQVDAHRAAQAEQLAGGDGQALRLLRLAGGRSAGASKTVAPGV